MKSNRYLRLIVSEITQYFYAVFADKPQQDTGCAKNLCRVSRSGFFVLAVKIAIFFSITFFGSSVAMAATITNGTCSTVVGSTSGVTLIDNGNGTCTITFASVGAANTWTLPSSSPSYTIRASGNLFMNVKGAVFSGTFRNTLPVGTQLTITVGGAPNATGGGFNGGGAGSGGGNGSGGYGATDIRLSGSRIIVAGGGGGSAGTPPSVVASQYANGEIGGSNTCSAPSSNGANASSGGDGGNATMISGCIGGGGGGGYAGGAGGAGSSSNNKFSGGAGSSFVNTTYATTTAFSGPIAGGVSNTWSSIPQTTAYAFYKSETSSFSATYNNNRAPTISGAPTAITVSEDIASNLNLSAATLADADNDSLTVTFTASAGILTATSGGSVTVAGSGTSTLTLTGLASNIDTYLNTASNIKFTTPADGLGPYTVTIAASDGTAGLASNPTVTLNVTPTPDVTNVTSSKADGHYKTGDTVVVNVTFDMTVAVTGAPTLTLETGAVDRTATYSGGGGTNTLSFGYVVQAGDTAADLDYVSTTALSGTITGNGLAADLTLASPGAAGSLGANKAIVIDTTVPAVTDAGISISGDTGTGGAFKVGDTVTAAWDTSGSDGDINITGSLGSVTVDFSAFGGGSAVAASLSGSTWTATYTILANTSTSGSNLNVAVSATDAAGNATTAADTSNATVNAVPPVVTAANINLTGASGTGGAFRVGDTVTASWDNTAGGDNNGNILGVTVDFTQFGGSAAVTASNSSGTWTATYTITAGAIDATNRNISVSATDVTGNVTTTADTTNATVDSQAPTVTDGNISINGASGTGGAFKVGDTVTASWNNTAGGDNNADIADVTVDFTQFGGSAAIAATNSSGTWTATYVITSGVIDANNRNVSVTGTDDAGNASTTVNTSNAVVDSQVPTVTLSSNANNPHSGMFTVTATFSEAVTGFVIGDVTVGNGAASNFVGTGTTYTFDITPSADGTVTIDVAANVAVDGAGNGNTVANQLTITADSTGPTVSLTSNANNPHSGLFTVTATFSEAVTGFVIGDVTVGNGTASNFVGAGTTYTFDVTPSADGVITIDVAASVAADAAGNDNAAAGQLTVTADGTGPTVSLTSNANNPHSGMFTVTATFSEGVTGFAIDDVTVGNGTASNFAGAGTTYTFDITPAADGAVTINIAAGVAQDSAGNGNMASNQLSVLTDSTPPTVTITSPENGVVSDFTATLTFSENVTGFEASDVNVVNGSKGTFSGSNDVYTLVITNPILGTIVSVSVDANKAFDAAGNGNEASNVFEVQAGSPASEFDKYRNEIRQILVEDAHRSLTSTLSVNQRAIRDARARFIANQRERVACAQDENTASTLDSNCEVGLVSRNDYPFDVDGTLALNGTTLSTSGNFFEQIGNYDGTYRRLFFGDFDVQHDADTDSTTATLSARFAWERLATDNTMLGYFVGSELARSTINGTFDGNQDRVAVTIGGYAVHQLADELYLDGFLSYGIGRNNLEIANDVLSLTSDYTTRTATVGAAISGVYEYAQYEFRPEAAFSYGKTWIGDVGFAGRAYGLVDDTLSMNAGDVSIANMTLRPEIIWAVDANTVTDSNAKISFAPHAICERTTATIRTENCGGGAELGLSNVSGDGLSTAEFRVIMDRVGSSNRSSFALNLEHRF